MNRLYFMNPAALWLMLLLAAVAALYLLRMPRTRLRLSSVAYLDSMGLEQKRRRRQWRTLVSMAIQLVLLALLAFAAAKPLISSGRVQERRIVVIVDASASMRARDGGNGMTRFEKAKQLAANVARGMEHGDRLLIVSADDRARVVHQFEQDRRTILRVIDAMQPGFQPTRLDEAFKLVREVIRPLSEPAVYLISDGAATLDPNAFKDVAARARYLRVGERGENVGIVGFSARRNLDSERDFSALISIRSTFKDPRKAQLKLEIGTNVIDVRDLTLAPGETRREMIQLPQFLGGRFRASLDLTDDPATDVYAVDNVAYEWIPRLRRNKVLVVAPQEEADGYLDAAMSANIGAMAYRLTPDRYRPDFAAEATMFYNCLPERFPDTHLLLVNTKGFRPDERAAEQFVLQPAIRSWDRTHPLMNYISLENLVLDRARRAKTGPGFEAVAQTVQTPIVLAGRNGANKAIYVAFDPRESDFPFRTAFPVLVGNALSWFAQEDGPLPATQIQPGEVCEIRVPESVRPAPTELAVTDPTGDAATVAVRERRALYDRTAAPGIYQYDLCGQPAGFAVNLSDPEESDIAPRDDIRNALKAVEDSSQAVSFAERELWFSVTLLVLFALCVESYLYHQRIVF